jgi:hypothetical protein
MADNTPVPSFEGGDVIRPASQPVDRAQEPNNATRRDDTQDAISEANKNIAERREEAFKDHNPTTEAKNTLKDAPMPSAQGGVLPGQKEVSDTGTPTVAVLPTQADRIGPGTGDGQDTRPLGDPNAPQGTSQAEVPGGNITAPAHLRPAPAGKVRTSWADGEKDGMQ